MKNIFKCFYCEEWQSAQKSKFFLRAFILWSLLLQQFLLLKWFTNFKDFWSLHCNNLFHWSILPCFRRHCLSAWKILWPQLFSCLFNSWLKFLLLHVVLPLQYICYIQHQPFRQKRRNKNRNQNIKKEENSQSILPGVSSRCFFFFKQLHLSHLGLLTLSNTVVTQIEQQLIFFHLYSSMKRRWWIIAWL